jgi:hypothetical protein
MKCPSCKNPMLVLELNQVEIDYCESCGGVWLDSGELELIAGSSGNPPASTPADKSNRKSDIKCPKCRIKMIEVYLEEGAGATVDRCTRGHGLWFDGGELAAVLEAQNLAGGNRILEVIRGIFKKREKANNKGDNR